MENTNKKKTGKNPNHKKNRRYTMLAIVLAVLVIVAIIPLNLLADRLNISWDMSSNNLYTLSDTSTEYLNNLDTDVKIYCLATMEQMKNDDSLVALVHLLEAYDSFDRVEVITFDPTAEPELLSSLNPEGKLNLDYGHFLITCSANNMIQHVIGNEMYYYTYKEDSDGNPVVTSAQFKGENILTGAIQAVVVGETPMVYFLTGHGETSLNDDYTTLQANMKNNNYGTAELNLAVTGSVPEDAKVLVSASPKSDFTKAETEAIDEYMDNGGNLILLMSPNEDKTRYTNIESIMYQFCIGMNYDRVYETDDDMHISGNPYIIRTELNSSEDIDITSAFSDSDLYVPYMMNSRSFYEVYGLNFTSLSMTSLMVSANTAVSEPFGGDAVDPTEIKNESLILAEAIEDSTRNNAKLLVFGNGEFLTDTQLGTDDGVLYIVPLYTYLGSVTWMYDSFVDSGISNRDKTYDYMTISSESQANQIQIIFGVIPVLVAAIGLAVWLKRRNS